MRVLLAGFLMLVPSFVLAQWTDDPLISNYTPIKAAHITELRTMVNAKLAACGRPPHAWTNAVLTPRVSTIKKVDMEELRAATTGFVSTYRAQAGLPAAPPIFSDPVLVAGATIVRAAHVREIRTILASASCGGVSCGSSNGQTLASVPVTNLCSDGSTPAVTTSGLSFTWSCGAVSCSASALTTCPGPMPADLPYWTGSPGCPNPLNPITGQQYRICEGGAWYCDSSNVWQWQPAVCAKNGPIFDLCP